MSESGENSGYFKDFFDLISPQIKNVGQVPLIKEALVYQSVADKFNCFVCGSPGASAKTSYKYNLSKVLPSFQYFSYSGHQTKIGLSEVIRRLREGVLFIDELDKGSGNDVSILRDVMQFQTLKMDKYKQHKEFDAKVNVFVTCNPKGNNDRWRAYGDPSMMKEQIPLSNSMYRRFHISIFSRDYNHEEFDKVNKHKVKYKGKNGIDKEKAEWMRDKILDLRQLNPEINVPESVYQWLKKLKYFEGQIVSVISNELIEGVLEVARANARLRESDKIEMCDWKRTLRFFHKCFETGGLNNKLIQKKLGIVLESG